MNVTKHTKNSMIGPLSLVAESVNVSSVRELSLALKEREQLELLICLWEKQQGKNKTENRKNIYLQVGFERQFSVISRKNYDGNKTLLYDLNGFLVCESFDFQCVARG